VVGVGFLAVFLFQGALPPLVVGAFLGSSFIGVGFVCLLSQKK
jgi:hypothetical protein